MNVLMIVVDDLRPAIAALGDRPGGDAESRRACALGRRGPAGPLPAPDLHGVARVGVERVPAGHDSARRTTWLACRRWAGERGWHCAGGRGGGASRPAGCSSSRFIVSRLKRTVAPG